MVRIRMKDIDPVLSAEELEELDRAEKLPPCYDEDCPEMTEEMLKQFKKVSSIKDMNGDTVHACAQ